MSAHKLGADWRDIYVPAPGIEPGSIGCELAADPRRHGSIQVKRTKLQLFKWKKCCNEEARNRM